MKRWPSHASFGPLKGRTGQAFWVLLSKKTQNFGRLLKSASVMGKSSSFRAHIHIQKRREGERGGEAEAAFTWRSCTQLTDRKRGKKREKKRGGREETLPSLVGKEGEGRGSAVDVDGSFSPGEPRNQNKPINRILRRL